jgi:prepilin-type N-terminal cleavage/methylation domain-containing protein
MKPKFMKKVRKLIKGFTLIELVVGVVIVAILSTVITAGFHQANKSKSLVLGVDIITSAIRTAQAKSLSGYVIPGSTCSQGNQASEYHLKFFPISTQTSIVSINLYAKDKCGNDYLLETYRLPNNLIISRYMGSVDSTPLYFYNLDIKFDPPFGKTSYSKYEGDPFVGFQTLTLAVSPDEFGNGSKHLSLDGITGKIDTDIAFGSSQTASSSLPNQPGLGMDCSNAAFSLDTPMFPLDNGWRYVTITGVSDPYNDTVGIRVSSIFQDELTNFETLNAWAIDGGGVGTSTAFIRAQRSGTRSSPGNGRVYHINFVASDNHGLYCAGEVKPPVAPSSGGTAVDDGATYDSTKDNPKVLTAVSIAGGIKLNWKANGSGTYKYSISRSTNVNGPFTEIYTVTSNAASGAALNTIDNSVVSGTLYYYKLGYWYDTSVPPDGSLDTFTGYDYWQGDSATAQ